MKIGDKQRQQFSELGFALVENVIPTETLKVLYDECEGLWAKAKRQQIAYIRVYEDYPRIFGGVNVAAIENPFFYAPLLAEWLASSVLDELLSGLTGWTGAELELARIHMNDRFKYQGFWHRDATINEADTSVVAIAYLQDENGFRIADALSQYSDASRSDGDQLQAQLFRGSLPGEHEITAPAGSVFFMKSYLLHRGYNNYPRLHLHMRFVPSTSFQKAAWANVRLETAPYDFKKSSAMDRAKLLVNYFWPHKNRSTFFQR